MNGTLNHMEQVQTDIKAAIGEWYSGDISVENISPDHCRVTILLPVDKKPKQQNLKRPRDFIYKSVLTGSLYSLNIYRHTEVTRQCEDMLEFLWRLDLSDFSFIGSMHEDFAGYPDEIIYDLGCSNKHVRELIRAWFHWKIGQEMGMDVREIEEFRFVIRSRC
jgi:hypothetical protein